MKFGFDRIPDEIEGLMDFGVKLFLRETIGEFHFDRGMERLTAEFGSGRNLFGVGRIEF